jgi:hypothetical protein
MTNAHQANFMHWLLSDAEARSDAAAIVGMLQGCYACSPDVLQQAAGALVRMVQAGGGFTAAACVNAHALGAVLMTQQAHRGSAKLQLECVRLLSELRTHSHLYPWNNAVSVRAIDGAVAALCAHGVESAELAFEACALLLALTTHSHPRLFNYGRVWARAVGDAVRGGAVPAVLAVLAAHSERRDNAAVAHAHKTLAWFTTDDGAGAAYDAGALPQLVAALRAHRQPQALAAACEAVATIIADEDARAAAAAAEGAVNALCDVLADYPRFPDLQAHACAALGRLARRPGWRVDAEVVAAAFDAGALDTARAALARHPAHDALRADAEALVQLLEWHARRVSADAAAANNDAATSDDATSGDDDASEEDAALTPPPASMEAMASLLCFMRDAALDEDAEAAPPEQPPLVPPPNHVGASFADAAATTDDDEEPSSACWSVCVFCRREQRCVLLLPCRHLVLCGKMRCADRLGFPPCRTCPLCRASIDDTLVVFPL